MQSAVRTGSFNYMSDAAEASLYRNGKVLTRRDLGGSDGQWQGVDLVPRAMPVEDARQLSGTAAMTLAGNGFEVHRRPLPRAGLDFLDHGQVVKDYYPHCAEIVREATGARRVAAFDHNVRSAIGKAGKRQIKGGQQVQGPARVVHGDYTLSSAPQRLRDLTRPPGANDTLRAVLRDGESLLDRDEVEQTITGGRYGIVNLWRSIAPEPVAVDPLALCDARCVRPEDLVVFEIHYADRVGENYFAKHAAAHRWYFYPGLTRDEALLIKQWDSAGRLAHSTGRQADGAGEPCSFSFHSAFEDASTPPDAPARWSIEVRCAVLFD